jgi:glycosyltransferase involved in cell wall biosynthesis
MPNLRRRNKKAFARTARAPLGRRVLVIAPQPFFLVRGTPLNIKALVTALSEQGYAPDLLVYPLGEPVSVAGVRIIRSLRIPGIRSVPIGPSWTKVFLDVFVFFKALELVIRHRYVAIHGIEEGGFIAGMLARLTGVPFVFDMDSCMVDQLRQRRFLPTSWLLNFAAVLERNLISHADAVLTVCRALTDHARRYTYTSKIHQIEDFPLESSNSYDPELLNSLRHDYGIGEAEKVIVYTGNFEPYQGVDLLLEAYSRLVKNNPACSQTRLMIVGGGGEGQSRFDSCSAHARELGIESRVVFTGNRPGAEMGTFMQLADVLASPRTEGDNTPLKVYSYMASQTPIVATNISTHTQVLSSETAFLSEPNEEAFAEALMSALDDSPMGAMRVQRVVAAAKDLVDRRYNYREFRRRVGVLYAELLGGGAAPRYIDCDSDADDESKTAVSQAS